MQARDRMARLPCSTGHRKSRHRHRRPPGAVSDVASSSRWPVLNPSARREWFEPPLPAFSRRLGGRPALRAPPRCTGAALRHARGYRRRCVLDERYPVLQDVDWCRVMAGRAFRVLSPPATSTTTSRHARDRPREREAARTWFWRSGELLRMLVTCALRREPASRTSPRETGICGGAPHSRAPQSAARTGPRGVLYTLGERPTGDCECRVHSFE